MERVTVPEGLQENYERVFLFIASTGPTALALASRCLVSLTRKNQPKRSHYLREVLVIQNCLDQSALLERISDFEESVLMSCADLIERCPETDTQNSLRLVHISIKDMANSLALNKTWVDRYINCVVQCIISDISSASMDLARCCVLELLRAEPESDAHGQAETGSKQDR